MEGSIQLLVENSTVMTISRYPGRSRVIITDSKAQGDLNDYHDMAKADHGQNGVTQKSSLKSGREPSGESLPERWTAFRHTYIMNLYDQHEAYGFGLHRPTSQWLIRYGARAEEALFYTV
jgi:hypothetical protein